eukprot:CAMPEP_0172616796 /NCGR_PEP_ID=MMETSP1068-20121228/67595_1 /TAXON_ID=35684 /ORGANISM="Pseudopedinella elastica, Strain CCMP716" /LENGTH=36 /DNA_ID= /DNA_START= /DNA_END= /DNA_ORIENTATION=
MAAARAQLANELVGASWVAEDLAVREKAASAPHASA